jgi:hypothetical protein
MPKTKAKKSVADTATSAKGATAELPKELIDQLLAPAVTHSRLTGAVPRAPAARSIPQRGARNPAPYARGGTAIPTPPGAPPQSSGPAAAPAPSPSPSW